MKRALFRSKEELHFGTQLDSSQKGATRLKRKQEHQFSNDWTKGDDTDLKEALTY